MNSRLFFLFCFLRDRSFCFIVEFQNSNLNLSPNSCTVSALWKLQREMPLAFILTICCQKAAVNFMNSWMPSSRYNTVEFTIYYLLWSILPNVCKNVTKKDKQNIPLFFWWYFFKWRFFLNFQRTFTNWRNAGPNEL